jgi:DNA repair protein RecO (recombination protein O)
MHKRTQGIVLKNTVFGEADLIVTYLTRDYGVMRLFAKGPRKTKSRFGSSFEPLSYAAISFFGKENSNLPRLTQSDIIRPFHFLRSDLNRFMSIIPFVDLSLTFLPEQEPNKEIFELLLATLDHYESHPEGRLYPLYYTVRFLDLEGYSPRLDGCAICGKRSGKQRNYHFSISNGSLLCEHCEWHMPEAITVSEGALEVLRGIAKWKPAHLHRVAVPDCLLTEIGNLINAHIQCVLEQPLRSSVRERWQKDKEGVKRHIS